MLYNALRCFSAENNFGGGYGGERWEACALATKALYEALAKCSHGKASAMDVIMKAHVVVSSAHNNGPMLDKFIEKRMFDKAAAGEMDLAAMGLRALAYFGLARTATATWPLPRTRATTPRPTSTAAPSSAVLQWHLERDNGTTLHVQYGVYDKYRSVSVPLKCFGSAIRRYLTETVALGCEHASFAGSHARYTRADLPVVVLHSLAPALGKGVLGLVSSFTHIDDNAPTGDEEFE
jgi:hypothetical protein